MDKLEKAREAAAKTLEIRYPDLDGWEYVARDAIDAFLASLAEDGMVLVPRAEITKLCDYADRGQGYYYNEFVCDDAGEADAKEWSDFVDGIRAMIAAAQGDGT